MATVKWAGSPTSRSTQLTTELNSLANNAFSAVGPAFDNTSNLDQWFGFDLVLASLNPTAGAYVNIYAVPSWDGTNYADAPSSTNPGNHVLVATLSITTGSAAKRQMSLYPVQLPPGKMKFVIKNGCGVAFGASSNTLTLYSMNESVA
jgi:hypothetical protein